MTEIYTCDYYLEKKFTNWKPKKFNWKHESHLLPEECAEYFKIWWDPKKYNWSDAYYLAEYCSGDFNIWWDSNKWDWEDAPLLLEYCWKDHNTWWPDFLIYKLKQ